MEQTNKSDATFMHLSTLFGYVFPFGNIVVPLIFWQTQKDKNTYLNDTGKAVLNFNISYMFYSLIITIGIGLTFFGNFILFVLSNLNNQVHIEEKIESFEGVYKLLWFVAILILMSVIKITLVIIGAVKANRGELFNYPLSIKFIN